MGDTEEQIKDLKAEIYDILVDQAKLQEDLQELEKSKQNKRQELSDLENKEKESD